MTDDVDEFLAHFGVKGMHWGVRKASSKSTRSLPKRIAVSLAKKGAAAAAVAVAGTGTAVASSIMDQYGIGLSSVPGFLKDAIDGGGLTRAEDLKYQYKGAAHQIEVGF